MSDFKNTRLAAGGFDAAADDQTASSRENDGPIPGKRLVEVAGSSTAQAISKNVAAAATPEPLGTGSFNGTVIAKSTNTATLYLGDATNQYAPMAPGDERQLVTSDLSKWYCKVGVNGEGVYLVGG